MTTLPHPETVRLARAWEELYPSAVISGIVGDPAHQLGGGYHISIEDNRFPTPNYSVIRPDDKAPPGTWPRNLAAAVDMSMNTADMIVCHLRLRAVFADRTDPRRVFINGWNGWDGLGSAGRYDMVTNTIGFASADHKWHIHLEIRRRWVTSRVAADAILSIVAGQTKQQYLDGDDMATTLMRWSGHGAVVITNGVTARWVSAAEVADLRTLHNEGAIPLAYGGEVRVVGRIELLGVLVGRIPPDWPQQPEPAPVVLSDDDLNDLKNAILAQISTVVPTPQEYATAVAALIDGAKLTITSE